MKCGRGKRECGATLIELLICIGVFAVVLGVGFNALIRLWSSHGIMRRQADAIVEASETGERWRADIRSAAGPIRNEAGNHGPSLVIPAQNGEITWRFSEGVVWRQGRSERNEAPLLRRVRSSRMNAEIRGEVESWCWELELDPVSARSRTIPLYSFFAVKGGAL